MSPHCSLILLILSTILLSSLQVFSKNCSDEDKKVLRVLTEEIYYQGWLNFDKISCCCCDLHDTIRCDENTGRVTSIEVSNNPKNFTIPPIIAKLPSLTAISFLNNSGLTGPIPSELGTMTNLEVITLTSSSLTGSIPDLRQLKKLELLDLSFNQLTGSIPPYLGSLPAIFAVDLRNNHLTGSIPESLGPRNMVLLILSNNNLSGAIPQSFARNKIDRFDVSRNKLTGDASQLFGVSNEMRTLDLSWNQLEFNMSKVVFQQSLVFVSLEHNKIYGTLPDQIGTVSALYGLNVSYNRLCGRIPTNLATRFIESSFFHNKCLCGAPLPACK